VGVRRFMPAFLFVVLVSCGSLGIAQTDPGAQSAGPADRNTTNGNSRTGTPAGSRDLPSLEKDPPLESMSSKWRREAVDTGASAEYLTETERQVLLEINKVRADPAEYAKRYLAPLRQLYIGKLFRVPGETAISTNEGAAALDECIKELQQTRPRQVLSPRKGMSQAARDHAKDQSRTGATGHTGKDGSTASERINRYGKWDIAAGENIDYGNGSPRMIVVSLLVDDGVPSRGHRRNLLDRAFRLIGLSAGSHPLYRYMCVMDFAGAYN
jgi:uncharacterized protein YkwD